jgi:putative transposon-encoded protein
MEALWLIGVRAAECSFDGPVKSFCNYSANTDVLIPKEYLGAYFSSVIRVTRADTQVRPYTTTVHP